LDAIPESLANLTNLIQLELENNKFEKLDFKCPQSVTVLLLNDNSIHEIGENFFKNCKNLVKLEIHKNKIERLPRDFGILCPNMKSLGLNNNCLSKLPDILEVFLPSIELIELSSNQFKLFPAKALKNCFGLVELHMANNPDFDDEIPTGFLDKNTKIEKFDFSKTKLSKLP
jgi:Leucine-rich repeat (LRR) protein